MVIKVHSFTTLFRAKKRVLFSSLLLTAVSSSFHTGVHFDHFCARPPSPCQFHTQTDQKYTRVVYHDHVSEKNTPLRSHWRIYIRSTKYMAQAHNKQQILPIHTWQVANLASSSSITQGGMRTTALKAVERRAALRGSDTILSATNTATCMLLHKRITKKQRGTNRWSEFVERS